MMPVRQKQVADRIFKNGFNSQDFEFTPLSALQFNVHYKPNRFYLFSVDQQLFYMGVPGANGNPTFREKAKDWEGILKGFDVWLEYLSENIDAGNPWEEIQATKENLNNMQFDSYEEMLNEDEQKTFSAKIDMLVEHFETLQIDVTAIRDEMEHLKEMSSKVSKKDVFLLFLGTITSLITSAVIPANKVGDVWNYIITMFSSLKMLIGVHGLQ